MPTNYTATPTNVQPPSPAPGPGTQPIASLPVDADALNAASVYQMTKTPTDYIGYLQQIARWRPPRTPIGVTGFTSVTHTGSGGGTIDPASVSATQSQPTCTPYNFVYKIIVGGAVGTATFQVSLDGGNTFGATTTTAATYTEVTSGVTVAMSGTMVASDTYAFSGTDTPEAAFVDSTATLRGQLVDHFGLPLGYWSEFREDWANATSGLANQSGAAYPSGLPRWLYTSGSSGSITDNSPATGYASPYLILATGATINSQAALIVGGTQVNHQILNPASTAVVSVLVFDWGISSLGANNLKCFAGWCSGASPATASEDCMLFYWSSGSTVLQFIYGPSGGTNSVVIPFTPSGSGGTPNMRCRIEFGGSGSPLPGIRAFVNGSLVLTVASGLPTATMNPLFQSYASGSSPTANMEVGAVRAVWSRWSAPELL